MHHAWNLTSKLHIDRQKQSDSKGNENKVPLSIFAAATSMSILKAQTEQPRTEKK